MLALTLALTGDFMVQRVTMSDVAREAGVSLMTVSRVVNNKGEISPETRERIQEVIEKLGYRPSGIARSLAAGQTYTIGLVVPDIANPYFSGIAHGVTSKANAEGFGVLLCDCEEDTSLELTMLDVLEEKRVDGVIVAAPRTPSDALLPVLERHQNVVVVNRLFEKTKNPPASGYVLNNDKLGAYTSLQHFIERGHQKIGFLAGPSSSYGSKQRMIGYYAALEENNLEIIPEIIQHCIPTVQGGKKAAVQLLDEYPEITALFCFNDLVAIGALQCCQQIGRKVPADLAVIGYDDIPMASWVTPTLTTCKVNFEGMGSTATHLLINQINDCANDCNNIVLEPQLIIRDSAP
jgi:LacI family transcriptional regulator